jgi:hypothetical protein
MNVKIKSATIVQTFVAIVTNASVMDAITIIKALANK